MKIRRPSYVFLLVYMLSSAFANFSPGRFVTFLRSSVDGVLAEWAEEFRYRKSPIAQYRQMIIGSFNRSIDSFQDGGKTSSYIAQKEFETYLRKFNQLYEDSLSALKTQKFALEELNTQMPIRSPILDDSLEQFRKFYNETANGFFLQPKVSISNRRQIKKKGATSGLSVEDSIEREIQKLSSRLQVEWILVKESAFEGVNTADKAVRTALLDITKFQEELLSSARSFADVSQDSIQATLDKRSVRREFQIWRTKLRALETERAAWSDAVARSRKKLLDTALKSLQDRVQSVNVDFEELILKRRASLEYTSLNDATLKNVLDLIDPSCPGWDHIKSEDGYEVYRRHSGSSRFSSVKCYGIVNAPAEDVLALFEDNSRVQEYNSFCEVCRDIEYVSDDTKITWACSPPVFPLKPRDFCTLIHVRKLRDGTFIVLNRATEHPEAPVTSKYVRAKIVLAANIIQPLPGDPSKCKLTMMMQLDPGGFSPPVIVNHVCTLGPPGFLRNVDIAARKKSGGRQKEGLLPRTLKIANP